MPRDKVALRSGAMLVCSEPALAQLDLWRPESGRSDESLPLCGWPKAINRGRKTCFDVFEGANEIAGQAKPNLMLKIFDG